MIGIRIQKRRVKKGLAAKKKTPKARNILTKELVIESAISYADRHGIESLSMRNLANSLGVEAMSLYNHVQNKDGLLDAMVESCVKHFVLPKVEGDWKLEMKKRAKSVRSVLMIHPWLTLLLVSRVNIGDFMLRFFNDTLGCLVQAGFSYKESDHIINTIDSHIYGFTLQELNFPFHPSDYESKAKEYLPMINQKELPYFYHLSKEVATGRYNGKQNFDFGLDIILEGFHPKPKNRKMS